MHHMQSNYQDNVSDFMTSFHFMNQFQHPFHLAHQHHQYDQPTPISSLDFMSGPPSTVSTPVYEPMMMLYPGLPMVFDANSSNSKLHMNDEEFSVMQNSYHISPSFTLVPPSSNDTFFDEQEQLQKNLVKDVFFSPAMIENKNCRDSSRLSLNDDCHSLVSDTTTLSVCSPSYQYEMVAEEQEEQVTSGAGNVYNNDDQVLFFYGLDLATGTEEEKDTKTGLGTTTTTTTTSFSKNKTSLQQETSPNNRRIKQQMMLTGATKKNTCLNDRSSTKKKNKKTCNSEISKLLSTNNTIKKKSTRKNASNSGSNENSNCSDATSASTSCGYKKSDNKKLDSLKTAAAAISAADEELLSMTLMPNNKPRFTASPSIYQKLSKQNIDWCRYCGTTEGVNWRPGPWGKRTLCNKHGCDYKGYGFACKLPRLDLTSFTSETIDKRTRPVLQLFCSHCQRQESWKENQLVLCDGCPKAFHQKCHHEPTLTYEFLKGDTAWYCSDECQDNLKRKRVVVELPRKRLPLMRTPKNATLPHAAAASAETSTAARLPRSSLREI